MSQEIDRSLAILPAALAESAGDWPFAAIVKSRDEFRLWLENPLSGVEWLQLEGLLVGPEPGYRRRIAPPTSRSTLFFQIRT